MFRAAPIVLAALILAGCMTAPPPGPGYYYPPPSSSQRSPSGTARPAQPARSAVAPSRSVKPLGQGVLSSNVVEGYMDGQESDMRVALRGSGIVIARTGNDLLLSIKSDVLFEPQSMSLSAHGAELVGRIAAVVRKYDSTLLVANGFTDTTGSREQNLAVSQKRADAVAGQLSLDGVDRKRLAAKGFGDEILKIPTGPNVSESRNRRIEIRITPMVRT